MDDVEVADNYPEEQEVVCVERELLDGMVGDRRTTQRPAHLYDTLFRRALCCGCRRVRWRVLIAGGLSRLLM